jgi:ribosomal protein S18 acetylase RimI-like enzyme
MEISELTADHADGAVALWHESGLTRPWNNPQDDYRRAVEGPTSAVLGAQDEAGVVGTAMVGHDGHRGWVYYLAVRDDVRRTGLGSHLMRAAEEWLGDRGVPKVNVMVRTTNTAVVGFYESLGYQDGEVLVLGKFLDA